MTRFFIPGQALDVPTLHLTDENFQHARVLRLKPGEQLLVCDGAGREALCTVAAVGAADMTLEVAQCRQSETEAAARVSVYMAFPSARCVSRPDEKSLKKKLERWQKIAASAAEQSGRGRIPQVLTLGSYREALERAAKADKALLFYENEHATTLRMALSAPPFGTVSLLTGPEGGLEESEVAQARSAGMQICTLGRRILRCETAPLCALSAVMYAAGEF